MIRAEKYNVVLSGQLLEGVDLSSVKESFKEKFKLKAEQVDRMFSGHSKVLKKGLDHKAAYHYKRIINDMGAEVDIKRVVISPDSSSLFSLVDTHEERHNKALANKVSSKKHACPNCHSPRSSSSACMSCGVLFDKNNHRLQRNNEIKAPSSAMRRAPVGKSKDPHKAVRRSNPNTFSVLKLLSYACFAFCFADLSLYFLDIADITGIAWSPLFAWSAGYLLSLLG